MKYLLIPVLIFLSCDSNPENTSNELKANIILSEMTLDEKIGQMAQINLTVIAKGPSKWKSSYPLVIDPKRAKKAIKDFKIGSIINTINGKALKPSNWRESISQIQNFAIDSTRIKIPIIYGIDGIHGAT